MCMRVVFLPASLLCMQATPRWSSPLSCSAMYVLPLHAGFAVVVVTSATVAATVLGAEIYEVTDTKVIATKEARVARSGAGGEEDARAREGAES